MKMPDSIPARIARLPRDQRGYPVPWFVAWLGDPPVPDFRVVDERKPRLAVERQLCWICGDPLGVNLSFVVGPMCGVNRTSAEPPSHLECGIFAAVACPFLNNPRAQRRETAIPEGTHEGAGLMIRRNPGVTLVWTTRKREVQVLQFAKGMLFKFGDPLGGVLFFAEGRRATRAEIDASVESGMPLLLAEADREECRGCESGEEPPVGESLAHYRGVQRGMDCRRALARREVYRLRRVLDAILDREA